MLFKAGDFSMGLEKSEQAIMYFDQIIANYPAFEKLPYCLFLKGFIYENQMGNMDQAKEVYLEFLNKYPDHEMAESARFSIKNLGKSPEELIKEFEKNQQTDSVRS
jgi:TolA-binding protein